MRLFPFTLTQLRYGFLKVGFFQKVTAEYSNLSNRHACEPKIVSELLFPVSVVDTLMANILNTFS